MNERSYTIAAVADALRILEWVARQNAQLTLSEIAGQMEVNKSKVFRILHTFETLGYVQRTGEEGRYALGERMVELGSIALTLPNLPAIARPQMRRLLEKYGETVFLALLDGVDVLHLEVMESTYRVRILPSVDAHNVAHRTSLGKAILAYLPPDELAQRLDKIEFDPVTANTITSADDLLTELQVIRERRFAIDNEESEIGARCVGAPVLNSEGWPVAALSIEAPADRLGDERLQEIGQEVLAAAQACSEIMGYSAELHRKARVVRQ